MDSAGLEVLENSDFKDHKVKFVTDLCIGRSVLDIGCVQHDPSKYQSKYWLHKAIRRVSLNVIGLDIDRAGVDYLRLRGFDIVVGDAQNFDFEKSFDVIVAGDLIEHLANLEGFFQSCRSNMHAESKLLISTPNPWFWKYPFQALYKSEIPNNPEHTCWFCPRTLKQLASRYGFEIEKYHFGSRFLKDKLVPLPRGLRHGSFHAVLKLTDQAD